MPSLPRPGEDVTVSVSHAATVLVPARDAGLPSMRRVCLSTPATIRGVDPGWFSGAREMPVWKGKHRSVACRPRLCTEGGGRLWRPVRVRGRNAEGPTLGRALDALASPGAWQETRLDLTYLRLDPFAHHSPGGIDLAPLSGRAGPRDSGTERDRPPETSALAQRIAHGLVHDGDALWLAVTPPLLSQDEGVRTCYADEPDVLRAVMPATTSSAVMGYVRFFEEAFPSSQADWGALIRRGAAIEAASAGLDADPLADLRHFVENYAIALDLAAARFLRGVHANRLRGTPAAMRALAALRGVAAAASTGLAGRERIEAEIATIRTAAEWLAERSPYAHVLGIQAETAIAYVRHVALPRLAERPVPDEDADPLGSLTP